MRITVHVKPGSRSESVSWAENLFGEKTLVVKIREKPIEAFSDFFTVSKSSITMLHGHTSREKVVEIKMD